MMKVNYTLPGVLPDTFPAGGMESGEHATESFGHLQRLRVPDATDWRSVLRLDEPPAGVTTIAPPLSPNGIGSRDGTSQRAWWRSTLHRHRHLLESSGPEAASGAEADGHTAMQRMLGLLFESQQHEEEIFARYFAEHQD
jgi:hypothetical protein